MSDLRDLAKEVYTAHGCTEQGYICLVQKVTEADLTEPALLQFAHDALREREREFRASLGVEPKNTGIKTFTAEQQASVAAACKGFLDWPLMDHTPLRDATREQVEKDRERWSALAAGNARSARFLGLVVNRLKEGQTVGAVLSERQLAGLFRRAERG